MNYIKISVVLFLVIFSSCCNQYSKRTSDPTDSNEMQPANLMKQNSGDKLSPGTAKVLSTILYLPDTTGNIRIKVKSVLGYGMATRPIAPDTEMEIFVPEAQKDMLKDLKQGDELNLVISQEQKMQSKEISWTVVEVIN